MTAAGGALLRLRSLQQSRGWFGLLRFLATRLARSQSDVLFERETDKTAWSEQDSFGIGRSILVVDRNNLDDPGLQPVVRQLLAGESIAYRHGLTQADMALAVIDPEGTVLHRSFIQFETRYKSVINESRHIPLIANCHTLPEARGERLYPKALRYATALLARQGHERAIITCDRLNLPSIRGIEHAGFLRRRMITSLFIGARLVLQRIQWSDQRTCCRVVLI